jgi:putative ABC transport system ATP-binding protein
VTPGRAGTPPGPALEAAGVRRLLGNGPHGFALQLDRLVLQPGDRLAVVGPSGSGKSTLLGLLSLALRPDQAGVLRVLGEDVWALWQRGAGDALAALRARALGFVPQTAGLLPFLTLHDNIALSQTLAGRPDAQFLAELARRLDITTALDRRPAEVSVGQRQRAAIARALAHRPAIVLADEPTASVHPAQADDILALLATMAGDGVALLVTTHDPDRATAAGFILAPCMPGAAADGTAHTSFGWNA